MSLENTVGNILRGIAVVSSLYTSGCGTTIYTQKGGVWHDCNSNEDYPQGHPCYAEVEAYRARIAAASSPPMRPYDSDRPHLDAADRSLLYGERRAGERRGRDGQHRVCPK